MNISIINNLVATAVRASPAPQRAFKGAGTAECGSTAPYTTRIELGVLDGHRRIGVVPLSQSTVGISTCSI